MFGLLGGESSFSDSSDSEQHSGSVDDEVSDKSDSDHEEKVKCKEKLPLPDLEVPFTQQGQLSVFSNQYKEEEEAKKAVLERHVELSSTAPVTSAKQAKKERRHQSSFSSQRKGKQAPPDHVDEERPKVKRKRHSGLSGTLQPPKKFMQSFHKQQAEEKPWLNKK